MMSTIVDELLNGSTISSAFTDAKKQWGDTDDVWNQLHGGNMHDDGHTVAATPMIENKENTDASLKTATKPDSTPIPTDFNWNGHFFKIYDIITDWQTAKDYCESLGGHLATITSEDEQNYVQNMIKNANKNEYWLGASNSGGEWQWVTGEDWNYTNWADVQPNIPSGEEQFLEMYRSITGPTISTFPINIAGVKGVVGAWYGVTADSGIQQMESSPLAQYVGFICEWDQNETNNLDSSDMTSDPESMYSEIISEYQDAIQNNYYSDYMNGVSTDDSMIGKDVNRELLSTSRDYSQFHVYYAFIDINNDGIPEMLIGAGPGTDSSDFNKYDFYSWSAGQVYRFSDDINEIDFGYRLNFSIQGDIITVSGSNSAFSSDWGFYTISQDGHTPTLLDYVSYEDPNYYEGENKDKEITKDEFKGTSKNRHEMI